MTFIPTVINCCYYITGYQQATIILQCHYCATNTPVFATASFIARESIIPLLLVGISRVLSFHHTATSTSNG